MATRNRIESLRNASQISRPGLADRLGVSERTIYRYEQGQVQIPDEQKLELARIFGGVSVAYMMGWEEDLPNGNGNGGERVAA